MVELMVHPIASSHQFRTVVEPSSHRSMPGNSRSKLLTVSFVLLFHLLPSSFAAYAMASISSVPVSAQAPTSSNTATRNTHKSNSNTFLQGQSSSMEGEEKKIDDNSSTSDLYRLGKLQEIKEREAALSRLLSSVRQEKLATLRSRPLTIGVIGFGRFGQFIARSFAKHGQVVVTSRSDYTDIANGMGVKYIPLSDPKAFLEEKLDVIVLAVSILSFESTVQMLAPHLENLINADGADLPGPLIVDVLSVKEHPREILLDLLPPQCDILCTHPMFGPDSGRNGWHGLTFVYERTRIHGVVLDPDHQADHTFHQLSEADDPLTSDQDQARAFVEISGEIHSVHEDSEGYVEGMDRMERFLSIWEEEGCRMVPMSSRDHDEFAANSQFITHLMGRILETQGLKQTPIDTRGFESVLKLVGTTTADSFDLFYGLYKYNRNSMDTILKLRESLDDVVKALKVMEKNDIQGGNG